MRLPNKYPERPSNTAIAQEVVLNPINIIDKNPAAKHAPATLHPHCRFGTPSQVTSKVHVLPASHPHSVSSIRAGGKPLITGITLKTPCIARQLFLICRYPGRSVVDNLNLFLPSSFKDQSATLFH